MNKEEILQQIAELLALQENVIQQHPPEVAAAYIRGRDAFIEGQPNAKEDESSPAMSLTLDDLSLMHRYMLSSSFISAWYHLAGEKANRDKAAHSCAALVSGLGSDPILVMQKYVQYEQLWRRTIKHENGAPRSPGFVGILVTVVIIGIILYFIFAK